MSKLDRPFTPAIKFATSDSGLLYLQDLTAVNPEDRTVAALVYVEHKQYSVMCAVEDDGTRMPLACKIGGDRPDIMRQLINDTRAYKVATVQHNSDRDGAYKLHTLISNQLVAERAW